MSITVVRPGLLTTVQDGGRWGHQHQGVPTAGPMDAFSFRLANRLAGNHDWDAGLEITLLGPELLFDDEAIVAIAGADLSASVPMGQACRIARGQALRFGERKSLTRAYLAVRGGIDIPPVLGSRSTSLPSGLPGLAGRPLRAGERLAIGSAREPRAALRRSRLTRPAPADPLPVRFLWGPDRDRFTAADADAFVSQVFRISPNSNRMGYRLEGAALNVDPHAGRMLSESTPIGSIQVPPSGQPIVLMADRQTAGGYARIGTVISADLPLAGQLAPGETLRFVPCNMAAALAALQDQERMLAESVGPE